MSVSQPYSAREAMGQFWMKDLDNGVYASEVYVAHISKLCVATMVCRSDPCCFSDTPEGDNVVLLTSSRVLSLWSKKKKLELQLPRDSRVRFPRQKNCGIGTPLCVHIPPKQYTGENVVY